MTNTYLARLIEEYFEQDKRINTLEEVFSYVFDSPIISYGWRMFDEILNIYFTEEGVDWIYYYLLENDEQCYYEEDGTRVPLENTSQLWQLVKEYLK